MLTTHTLAFTLLLACVAAPGFAASESPWFQVEGGSWVPSPQLIAKVKGTLETSARKLAALEKRNLLEWKKYTFQYQGQTTHKKKVIFINAFCIKNSEIQPTKRMVQVMDGGACFFNVSYDPETDSYFDLSINGEA
jgi:hypothetical protein